MGGGGEGPPAKKVFFFPFSPRPGVFPPSPLSLVPSRRMATNAWGVPSQHIKKRDARPKTRKLVPQKIAIAVPAPQERTKTFEFWSNRKRFPERRAASPCGSAAKSRPTKETKPTPEHKGSNY